MRPRRLVLRLGRAALPLWSVLVLTASPQPARGFSTGITTQSFNSTTTGCNACHSGGTAPAVELTGPASVAVGTTSTFVFRVTPSGNQRFGGFNASAPAGALATGGPNSTQTQALEGSGERVEITHTARKGAGDGAVLFSFLWTAPDTPGTVSLRLWGNAVNGNGANSGDRASTLVFPVEVFANDDTPTPTPPPDTPTPTVTESPTPSATPTPTSPATPPCPGNCNGDTEVTVDEILIGVIIAQGLRDLDACPPFDTNGDGQVAIDDILAAVNAALNGCPK